MVQTEETQRHLKMENLLKLEELGQEWIAPLSLWNQVIE